VTNVINFLLQVAVNSPANSLFPFMRKDIPFAEDILSSMLCVLT
jgi:hypothetical protein